MEEFLSFLHDHFHGAVLLVTHNMAEADLLCDNVILYRNGKVLQAGPKNEVLKHAARQDARKCGTRT